MTPSPFRATYIPGEAEVTSPVRRADDTCDMQVYRPKTTTCLRCGDLFNSYDPRYNRRCASCSKTVQGQDDRYNY